MGRQLGRYEIVSFVASGGMASVFAGRALGMAGFERLVAIKVLHPHLADEHEFVSMFLDEARLAARIRHPNVVATLDVNSDEAQGFYLVMEYIEGAHLGRLLGAAARHGQRLPPQVALRVVYDALQGLAAAHDLTDDDGRSLELVHRDISPHNVLVGVDGVARLSDFGVARAAVRIAATRDWHFKGKLGYLAPEQVAQGRSDQRSDLFTMGVVLWEALAGRRLFQGEEMVEMLRAVLHQPIPPLSGERPELASLDPLLARALARHPEDRFRSAAEFADMVEAAAGHLGGMAQPRQVAETVRHLAPVQQPGASGPDYLSGEWHGATSRRNTQTTPPPPPPDAFGHPQTGGGQRTGSGVWNQPHHTSANHSMPRGSGVWQPPPTLEGTGGWDRTDPGYRTAPPKPKKRGWTAALAAAALLLAMGGGAFAFSQFAGDSEPVTQAPASPTEPIDAALLTGPGDVAPRLLQGDPPFAPDPDAALTPTIVLRLHLDERGGLVESTVYRSRRELRTFEEAAQEIVRSYTFLPAQRDGRPVPSWLNLPISFVRPPPATSTLRIRGSDTIGASLGPALARAFRVRNPTIAVQVEGMGSSSAFSGLFDGTADIGAASRAVHERELARARELGVQLQEFVIGYDGIAVVVHPDNPLQEISVEDLSRIFSGAIGDWRRVGGADLPLRVLSRPASSGTHAFFRERVLGGGDFGPRTEYVQHGSDIAELVASDPRAIAYLGLGAVEGDLRVLAVAPSPGQPAITPATATVADGSYPIYRPLLLYTQGKPAGDVASFLRFVLSEDGRRIVQTEGFVPSDGAGEAMALDGP